MILLSIKVHSEMKYIYACDMGGCLLGYPPSVYIWLPFLSESCHKLSHFCHNKLKAVEVYLDVSVETVDFNYVAANIEDEACSDVCALSF